MRNLEIEKIQFIKEYKRIREEDNCRFLKSSLPKEQWLMLKNRYQIVSLLGKGGFSEVYKAFDMDTMTFVACKIHQLHSGWSEQAKNNYIKHSLRENKTHAELNHPNIVKRMTPWRLTKTPSALCWSTAKEVISRSSVRKSRRFLSQKPS